MRAFVAKPQRPAGQLAKAERLAGVYRPFVDPAAQADAIAEVIKPLIAEHLAAVRAPRPEPSRHDEAVMQACKEVGAAVDRLQGARKASPRAAMEAQQNLERKATYLRNLIGAKEAGLGSR